MASSFTWTYKGQKEDRGKLQEEETEEIKNKTAMALKEEWGAPFPPYPRSHTEYL